MKFAKWFLAVMLVFGVLIGFYRAGAIGALLCMFGEGTMAAYIFITDDIRASDVSVDVSEPKYHGDFEDVEEASNDEEGDLNE